MPGAWEVPFREVLVAILTRETVTTAWAKSHRQMILPQGHEIVFLSGLPFDHARNQAVQMMLDGGYQYVFFVDDDVIVPPDAYAILRSDNLDIVSGLYFKRNEPIAPVAIVKDPVRKTAWLSTWKPKEIVPVYMAGAGCLLIKRRVFEMMPPPWFEWMADRGDVPDGYRTSEDFFFCQKLVDNYRIVPHVDTRVSCVHCGLLRSTTDGKIGPLTVI